MQHTTCFQVQLNASLQALLLVPQSAQMGALACILCKYVQTHMHYECHVNTCVNTYRGIL